MISLLRARGVRRFAPGPENPAVVRFEETIQPILIDYCYRCHADGMKKGGMAFDEFASDASLVRTGSSGGRCSRTSGPASCRRPGSLGRRVRKSGSWPTGSSTTSSGSIPRTPIPAAVTIRRLNRVEYRNTIRDLTGFDFKAEEEFPPDDSGYGFDNIGDVLSVSPLLLEKYIQAAESIVAAAVPTVSQARSGADLPRDRVPRRRGAGNGDRMTFYKKAKVSRLISADPDGDYRLALELAVRRLVRLRPRAVHGRSSSSTIASCCARPTPGRTARSYRYSFSNNLTAGDHD